MGSVQRRPKEGKPRKGPVKWVARYRDAAGKEHSKTHSTERAAKDWVGDQERALRRGEWISPENERITVHQLMERYAARPISSGSQRVYDLTVKDLGPLADFPLRSVTRADVDAWHRLLVTGRPWKDGKPLMDTTARARVIHLASAFKFAQQQDWVVRNPVVVPPKVRGRSLKRSQIPTIEDIKKIVELAEKGGALYEANGRLVTARPNSQLAEMIKVAVGSGMRAGEIGGLQVSGVHFLRREIAVEHQAALLKNETAPTKTPSSVRTIPVAGDLLDLLSEKVRGKAPGDYVFPTTRGTVLRSHVMGRQLANVVHHLGMPWTFHSFRHFYASRLLDAGVSIPEVARVMGHADASVTLQVYAHVMPDAADRTRAAIAGAVTSCGIDAGSGEVSPPAKSL